ncbi:leucine-rich repeat [Trichoderma arundinaceum]|uniref:Leucine-rich repeat n=1 Tax=Trichoderma arundinaceum TaxID=490622 RepID=A0A395NUZ1_TRIAR|nr:leucine-rich repeat [Trichoderma arundinaceum]
MSGESSLPRLPRLPELSGLVWDEHSQSFSNNPRKRARNHRPGNASSLSFNSSDPAVFSSDDDPGLDNYVEGRQKKRYVGSWFQQHLASSDSTFGSASTMATKTQRTLKRDFDSGVFLGSDVTDGEDLMDGLEAPALPRLPQLEKRPVPRWSEAEMIVRRKIQDCLDAGIETVDLWSMDLEELSHDTVDLIGQIACIPVVTKDVAFVQKEPELKLILSLNKLSRMPGSLFDITHLTVLSLRGNKLTELPSSISRLCNLKQLNISQNRFRHLPAEFLDLFKPGGKLHDLALFVNPFLQPKRRTPSIADGDHEAQLRPAPCTAHMYEKIVDCDEIPRYLTQWLGRSPLQFSDSKGQILSGFRLPLAGESPVPELPVAVASDQFGLSVSDSPRSSLSFQKGETRPSVVPSLVEIALQSCYGSSQLRDLESYMPDGLSHLQRLLQRASSQKDMGGLACSTCGKMMVVPPIEWLEWRELRVSTVLSDPEDETTDVITKPFTNNENEMAVPFLYRACSWRCGPKDLEKNKTWSLPTGHSSVEEVEPFEVYEETNMGGTSIYM